MGCVSAERIDRAVPVIFQKLQGNGIFLYSEIYDGSERTHQELNMNLGADDHHCPAEILVDLAVFQLENAGFLETEPLGTKLADGENDYRVTITQKGRKFVKSGKIFRCESVDL